MEKEITFGREMIYEMYSDVKNLQEMHIRHSGEMKNGINEIWGEVSRIKEGQHRIEKGLIDRVHTVEKETIIKTETLGRKIATFSVLLSIAVTIVTGVAVDLITKKITEEKRNDNSNYTPMDRYGNEGAGSYGDPWAAQYSAYPRVSSSNFPQSHN